MSNWRKVFQGLIILAILFGMLGAIACLVTGTGQGVTHPAPVVFTGDSGNSSNIGLTADSGQVFWASVAWNRSTRRSVAWN